MGQAFAARLVVIDEPHLAVAALDEPDGGRIADANIPPGLDGEVWLPRDCRQAILLLGGLQQGAVVTALDRRGEGAFELLEILVAAHRLFGGLQFALGNRPSHRDRQRCRIPIRQGLSLLIKLVELIAPLRRPNEDRTAQPIRQSRSNNLAPQPRRHVAIFIEHHPIKIKPPQPIRIIRAIEADPRTIRQINPQFGLVTRDPRNRRRIGLEIVPDYRLGLHRQGRNIGKARSRQRTAQRAVDQAR